MATKFNSQTIRALIAIGNPEKEYAHTYHNAGFEFIEALETPSWETPSRGHFIYTYFNKLLIIKTQTAMNSSGRAVHEACAYFKLLPEQLIICHDDSDLPLGDYKLQWERGSAGHNGIKSIIETLHTRSFWRLRIGIRNITHHQNAKADTFVLKKMSKEDRAHIYTIAEIIKKMFVASMPDA